MPPDRLALANEIADDDDDEDAPSFKVGLVRCPEISGFNRDDLIALCAAAGHPVETPAVVMANTE
eukprot:12713544-Prorocentrum_lima.AAC.1